MAKTKSKTIKRSSVEADSTYVLKLVLYLVIGSQWVFLVDPGLTKQIPIPVGLIIGLLFTRHEHFKMDRKIEYAVLLIAMLVGFVSNMGVYATVLK